MNIIETLTQQRKGNAIIEATEKLQNLVKACRKTGKKGKMTITLTIKPTNTEMMLADDIRVDLPKADAAASVFYDDEQGALYRDDPKQHELEFSAVEAPVEKIAVNN